MADSRDKKMEVAGRADIDVRDERGEEDDSEEVVGCYRSPLMTLSLMTSIENSCCMDFRWANSRFGTKDYAVTSSGYVEGGVDLWEDSSDNDLALSLDVAGVVHIMRILEGQADTRPDKGCYFANRAVVGNVGRSHKYCRN